MHARRAALDPADVQAAMGEVHAYPSGARQARSPAGRAGRRPGSWWRRGGRGGSLPAAAMRRLTSASVRYSRARTSAFGRRGGGPMRSDLMGQCAIAGEFGPGGSSSPRSSVSCLVCGAQLQGDVWVASSPLPDLVPATRTALLRALSAEALPISRGNFYEVWVVFCTHVEHGASSWASCQGR